MMIPRLIVVVNDGQLEIFKQKCDKPFQISTTASVLRNIEKAGDILESL